MAAGAITACCYYNSAFYYSRIMAFSGRRSMLFSSGDSLERFHRFFRGRDSMKGNKENRRSCFYLWRWPILPQKK